ncbi:MULTISPECIES: hypothetical protein [unclassified Brucella]|uniref:hypothetical protein n=1 Tax=Brucella sp. NF 2810 TaxID=3419591 RepID=UPI000310B4C5
MSSLLASICAPVHDVGNDAVTKSVDALAYGARRAALAEQGHCDFPLALDAFRRFASVAAEYKAHHYAASTALP